MERKYWEARYKRGGTSGSGSVGPERQWKWTVIRKAVRTHSPELITPMRMRGKSRYDGIKVLSVPKIIDVGCGDMSFLDVGAGFILIPIRYIGIDISDKVIMTNKARTGREGWNFLIASSHVCINTLRAPIIFCMDLLFHIMDDTEFEETLKNICLYSEDLLFIHTWKYNPLAPKTSDGIYQKYRLLDIYFDLFDEKGFKLVEEEVNPNGIGCMYVFKRK